MERTENFSAKVENFSSCFLHKLFGLRKIVIYESLKNIETFAKKLDKYKGSHLLYLSLRIREACFFSFIVTFMFFLLLANKIAADTRMVRFIGYIEFFVTCL